MGAHLKPIAQPSGVSRAALLAAATTEVRLLCGDAACAEDSALLPAHLARSTGARPVPFLNSHIR